MVTLTAVEQTIKIVGVDEAGRGALAGPVVAAACVLPAMTEFPVRIGDSKQMTPEEREASFDWITTHCVYGVGMVPAKDIDRMGILAANELAMQQAVAEVARVHPNLYVLIDGRDSFWFDHPHSSIVRGDQSEPCIGAASIIAKVTRDRWMLDLHRRFPQYGFDRHKGYGTSEHMRLITKVKPCVFHRKKFLKNLDATLVI